MAVVNRRDAYGAYLSSSLGGILSIQIVNFSFPFVAERFIGLIYFLELYLTFLSGSQKKCNLSFRMDGTMIKGDRKRK